ncbi:hypothetical protein L1049_008558 [Liquidambar formosana]|uniref:Uncharacterized protein n=1 Tax=Liquidambar formosana TaxID=63359 RepID=A0AAP0SAX9_LIQFO
MEAKTSFQDPKGQHCSFPITEVQSQSSDWIIPIRKKLGLLRERSSKSSLFMVPGNAGCKGDLGSVWQIHFGNGKKCRLRYAENIKFQPHQLAEIMLVDGCFILELFLRSSFRDFTEEDPMFYNSWMVPTLWHDLALLENQIPFFILQDLYDIVVPLIPESSHQPTQSITGLALSFFYRDAIREKCSQVADLYIYLITCTIFTSPHILMRSQKTFPTIQGVLWFSSPHFSALLLTASPLLSSPHHGFACSLPTPHGGFRPLNLLRLPITVTTSSFLSRCSSYQHANGHPLERRFCRSRSARANRHALA